ncbi:sugar ABC transporter permease [Eubacteriales bacterium OttesenSCG-928-N13]|nr:sugar ABC transporter permease [Eubacteriales bacterium OttesenSCG-928-N13]
MKGTLTYQRKQQYQYASLLLPAFILFTVGMIVPIFMCIYYSMMIWDGYTVDMAWVGLQNYINIFQDEYVMSSWKFTLIFALVNASVADIAALLLAVLLDSGIRGKSLQRTIVFIPCLLSAVVTGFVWKKLYSTVLPGIVSALGLPINLQLFGSTDTVLWGLTIANCWQWTGLWMMVYLAALQSIPPEYYEAARVDGANALQRFRNVTIPLLMPAIVTCTVALSTGAIKTYDILVTATEGGPGRASNTIVYYAYNVAFKLKQYGYGSAIAITLIVVLLLISVVQLALFRKKEVQL